MKRKMARQRGETYCSEEPDSVLRCAVTDCAAPVIAEVHTDSYAEALELFRGIRREKVHSRRLGDERFFVCRAHMESDERVAALEWQLLMFAQG
jgi:hypothetical protein